MLAPKWKRDLDTFRRDNWKCCYCCYNFRASFEVWRRGGICVDHLKPRRHGGPDEEHNRFTCCRACNAYKGQYDFDIGDVEGVKAFIKYYREIAAEPWFEAYVKGDRESQWDARSLEGKLARFNDERRRAFGRRPRTATPQTTAETPIRASESGSSDSQ